MKKISSITAILKKTVFIISLIALIAASFIAVSARFNLPGGLRIYSVLTGSMKPAVPVGSLIISKIPTENRDIKKGQIITFEQPGFEGKFVTHRVHEVVDRGGTRFFLTKGDANNSPDSWLISYGRVKGVYQRQIAYLGYFLEFLRSPFGIVFFVLLPVSLLAIGELKNIGSLLLEMKMQKGKASLKKETKEVKKKKFSGKIMVIILFVLSLLSIPRTFALFSSEPSGISSISVTTGTWANPGDVVVNELMWMGSSGNSDDEWIELKNTTGNSIDLSNWQITKWVAGTHEELMLTIPSGRTISANGYFLISNFNQTNSAISVESDLVDSGVVLTNSDLRIKLYKSLWTDSANLIDTADDGSGTPLTGVNGPPDWKSMERNNTPGDGTSSGSWHTCNDSACNNTTFWDVEGNNYGTPKAANLSENDPTSPTPSPAPTLEPESSPDPSPTSSPEISPIPTPSPTPEINPTPTPTFEPSPTPEPSPTVEPTPSPTPEPTPTLTPTPSPASEL